ncbi:hypothetical protein EH165_14115 [Nakamurella antarctica]|uniref:Uncharacterized protein n=1 Tax=Nakamurella antarctica TaxID=1902245 RepID=A0A3G8ZQM2_9ACTN|nr:hypothetical protein [Nakamurella antarctica]AZI59105.1 hypothetical protein EH165_14115 [Nakamurella antarctica]
MPSQRAPRAGDPQHPKVSRLEQLVSAQFKTARLARFWTVAELHRRIPIPLTYMRLTRFENMQVSLEPEVLQTLAGLLGLQLDVVLTEAKRLLSVEDRLSAVPAERQPVATLPSIRIDVAHLLARDLPWIPRLAGMLSVFASINSDEWGGVVLQDPLIRTIAEQAGLDNLQCWQQLSLSIRHPDIEE